MTDPALEPYHLRAQELTVEGSCVLWGIRVLIPSKLQQKLLNDLHQDHPGMSRIKSIAGSYLWWPKLNRDIEDLVRSCTSCQAVRKVPSTAPLHPWIWPSKPWQHVHIDFAGPFMGKMFLVIVSAHSKWPEVFPLTDITSAGTIQDLNVKVQYKRRGPGHE